MSFVTLHTGLSGLRAAQTAVDTTSNNISNVNTPGYTRQRVDLSPRVPYDSPVGQVGTGVEVDRVVRLRDSFLDARVRTTTAAFASSDTRATLLSRLEQVLSEPDQGISVEVDELWASLEDLALDPSSAAVRTTALGQLDAVAGRVREVASGMAQLRDETEAASGELLDEAQDLLASVAELNGRLANAPQDRPDNDLQDQRDVLLDRLAGLLGATSHVGPDGSATVTLDGRDLVAGTTVATLGVDADHRITVDDPSDPDPPVAVASSGELGGTLQVLGEDLPSLAEQLDAFVERLADDVNAQHAQGFDDSGAPGQDLLGFTAAGTPGYTPGDAAATLRLLPSATPDALALRGSATSGSHDNTNALALADLRTTPYDGGAPYGEQLRQVVVGLGSTVAAAGRSAEAAAEVTTAAQVARQSQHGVSLDEEMVSLVQFQRALEANSRVMTAADQMLDTIINGMGVVGR